MAETVKNSKTTFKGLMNGVIATTVITFAMVLVLIVLIFTVGLTAGTEGGIMAIGGITLVFTIISIVCDIAWIVCVAIALIKVSSVKQYINPTTFRVEFGICLGLYVLFWIIGLIGIASSILSCLQTVLLIVTFIFAIINKNKVK